MHCIVCSEPWNLLVEQEDSKIVSLHLSFQGILKLPIDLLMVSALHKSLPSRDYVPTADPLSS